MLDDLPTEILEHILGHLPSASSIVNLACVNHKLHASISVNQYAIFRRFVREAFPTIQTPPLWRDMAKQLTSRTRAWDRRAFIARECYPDGKGDDELPGPVLSSKFGYTPVIDSYEEYSGNSFSTRRNVLAFGAAGRLQVRTSDEKGVRWSCLRVPDDHLPQHDILDLRLLDPSEHPHVGRETIILRRADNSITRVQGASDRNVIRQRTQYMTTSSKLDCMDISTGLDAQLAVLDETSLQLFPLHNDDKITHPSTSTPLEEVFAWRSRKRCAKFLTNEIIATSVQLLEGRERAPILIYNVTPTNLISQPLVPTQAIGGGDGTMSGRHAATVLSRLDSTGSLAFNPGHVFLSGWTDAYVRLYDLRTPHHPTNIYWDAVDNGKIISLATCGHEKFFAGSHQNGCLKMFDMRMPGARPYSYFDIDPDQHQQQQNQRKPRAQSDLKIENKEMSLLWLNLQPTSTRKDINIFLALTVNPRSQLWEPLPPQDTITTPHISPSTRRGQRTHRPQRANANANTQYTRYRGSVYSLSTPSPSSSTLYAGIENHVIQLDFLNSDDIQRQITPIPPITQTNHSHSHSHLQSSEILNLSCYERPHNDQYTTDPVLLRKQLPWSTTFSAGDGQDVPDELEELPEPGWDERWRLGKSWKGRRRR